VGGLVTRIPVSGRGRGRGEAEVFQEEKTQESARFGLKGVERNALARRDVCGKKTRKSNRRPKKLRGKNA